MDQDKAYAAALELMKGAAGLLRQADELLGEGTRPAEAYGLSVTLDWSSWTGPLRR